MHLCDATAACDRIGQFPHIQKQNMASPESPKYRTGPQSQWSTLAVHAGEDREAKARGAVTDPIFCTSTYSFSDTQALLDFIVQKQPREEYARYGNPTEKTAEELAILEAAEDCVLYSTGMAAVTGLFLARLSSGDELVLFDELYQRTRELCENELSRFGIVTRIVPTGNFDELEAAITPATKLLFCESLTNPHLSAIDLERFAAVGRKARHRHGRGRHDGIALQPSPAEVRHRLCVALVYEVSFRAQRRAGRIGRRGEGKDGATAKVSRLRRHEQRSARRVSVAPRPEDVRTPHAAAQRERAGGGRGPRRHIRGSSGSITRDCRAIRTMRSRGGLFEAAPALSPSP